MDSNRFDNLTKAVAEAVSRRSMLKSVVAGAVLALVGVAKGDDLTTEARKRRSRNRKRHDNRKSKRHKKNKKQKKYECRKSDDCPQPSNPCEKKVCTGHKCQKENHQDGASCGNGQVCVGGQCQGTVTCPAGTTNCPGDGCVNTSDNPANCGACGVACGLDQPCQSSQCADCEPSGTTCTAHDDCCSGTCTCGSTTICQAKTFFQGFEVDTEGWFNNGPPGNAITRVPSGTDGINASSGGFFAELATGVDLCPTPPNGCVVGTTAFTRWGGNSTIFPSGGFTTEIDVYLNPDPDLFSGTPHFDYAVALNNEAACTFHSQFVMRYGKGTLPVSGDTAFCLSSSAAGTGYGPGGNPCQPPVFADMVVFDGPTGWYTFRHEFQDNGADDVIATMSVLDQQGSTVGTWVRPGVTSGVTQGPIGGNRYGWFPIQEFPFLAIDNSTRIT